MDKSLICLAIKLSTKLKLRRWVENQKSLKNYHCSKETLRIPRRPIKDKPQKLSVRLQCDQTRLWFRILTTAILQENWASKQIVARCLTAPTAREKSPTSKILSCLIKSISWRRLILCRNSLRATLTFNHRPTSTRCS